MRVLLGILIFLAGLAAAATLPEITFYDLNDQKAATLADMKGHVVVMNFWASWCGPCRMELPILQKIAKAHAKDEVKFITVNLDDKAAKAKSFIEKHRLELPVFRLKPETAQALGLSSIPVNIVLDKDGNVAASWAGMSMDFEKKIDRLIEDLTRR